MRQGHYLPRYIFPDHITDILPRLQPTLKEEAVLGEVKCVFADALDASRIEVESHSKVAAAIEQRECPLTHRLSLSQISLCFFYNEGNVTLRAKPTADRLKFLKRIAPRNIPTLIWKAIVLGQRVSRKSRLEVLATRLDTYTKLSCQLPVALLCRHDLSNQDLPLASPPFLGIDFGNLLYKVRFPIPSIDINLAITPATKANQIFLVNVFFYIINVMNI